MPTREEIIAGLFARTTQGIKFGLERIREAAGSLNNPQNSYNTIHVAGTNGKGSVCAFLESLLRHQGYSTGLFTSPHLVKFEERFIVNGKLILPEEWLEVYLDIEDLVDRNSLTFFEISTLIAFELFRRKNVDWAIIETGLGGRLDATNIVTPQASVITSLSVDHPEYLGDDILSVAGEKLGIVKKNTPLIMAKHNDDRVMELALQTCKNSGAPLIVADEEEVNAVAQTGAGNRFQYNGLQYNVELCGKYQIINALCALKTFGLLEMPIDDRTVQAINKTYLPGRFQIVTARGKDVVFDTAHNPEAAANLCKEIKQRFENIPVCIVTGIMTDKDKRNMLQCYAETADKIVITRPDTQRASDPDKLNEIIPDSFKGSVEIVKSVEDAVSSACETFNGVICVTGSFYTVGEAMTALQIEPYK